VDRRGSLTSGAAEGASAKGETLERLATVVKFEPFRRPWRAVLRTDGSKFGRPPFNHVFMWKVLILQASH